MFSSLSERFDRPRNRLYQERDRRLASGQQVTDLVSGNAQDQGLRFPAQSLQKAFLAGLGKSKIYHPDPFGLKKARQAISRYYRAEGLEISPEQLLLTPGTSLSYLYAFKLLGDSGSEFLCPLPSYPLFDSIAALANVRLRSYALRPEGGRWAIDWQNLTESMTERTRALILISPHNPTGAVASAEEVKRLGRLAKERDLAIISDEVFSPFVFSPSYGKEACPFPRPASTPAPLVLTLNGFSKMFALPGFKIGWMAVTGEASRVQKAITVMEMISDAFLPVHEAAQAAVPAIFQSGRAFLHGFQAEVRRRMAAATQKLSQYPVFEYVAPEGGFYFTIRLTKKLDDERFAYEALRRHGLLVHPGFFYDLDGDYFVLSGVVKPAVFKEAVRRLAKLAEEL